MEISAFIQYWLLYKQDIAYIITWLSVCVLSHMGRTRLCTSSVCLFGVHNTVCIWCVSNCVRVAFWVPPGLTIMAVSSLREGSVSVGWGPRAESLLLLTNRGVSEENTSTHVWYVQEALSVFFFLLPTLTFDLIQWLSDNVYRYPSLTNSTSTARCTIKISHNKACLSYCIYCIPQQNC